MNIQNLMRQAQKMQKDLQKVQDELKNTVYEGKSSLVLVTLNGNKDVLSVKINVDESFQKEDIELLEDMFIVAFNDASKKVEEDKEKKMGKYGQGLAGLM
ncbi:MAG: YbaB/EbfC family nucleoid-associated protein [Erysipelotrichaceae bacterium]|nr:YbaB/EbfC family nucleoid-associated protein [Erysipelotrichaceae bacterium]